MLKVAKSFEYAVFALRYIALNENGKSISAKEISETEHIPYDLLAKILQKLVKNKLVISEQGKHGGYRLNISPNEIQLTRILEALNQSIQFTDCMVKTPTIDDCGRVNDCCIRNPMKNLQSRINDVFSHTSLEHIINN